MADDVFEPRIRLSEADYIAAQNHFWWNKWRWARLALPILLVFGIYKGVVTGNFANFWLIWPLFAIATLALDLKVFMPRRARRIFGQSKSLQNEMLIRIMDEYIDFEGAGGRDRLRWADVHKWAEFSGLLVLYRDASNVAMIPKSQLEPGVLDYTKLRLIDSGLSKPGKARRA